MRLGRLGRLLNQHTLDIRCVSSLLLPGLMGLCLGMTLSMMYAPFSDDSCETFFAHQDPQSLIKLRDTKSVDSNTDEMYEPRQLDVENIDLSAYKLDTKAGSKFYRPKFAATELGIRQKLFVAVLSSKDSLNTRAVAVNKTLSRYVTKTVFFIDEKASVIPSGMMIVNFEDGYNHLLPINVLKYVIKKYGKEYDYYMFLTDKGYVRAEKIFDLVSLISVSKHVHLGAPKAVEGGKTYCAVDGGVIISQSILAQVNASMKWCADNCHHSDQSLNLGKCLLHVTDLECQSTSGNKAYSVYPVKDFNFDKDIDALKEQLEFNKSLSVFPMPDETAHYKIHRYFCEVELNDTRHQIQEMKDNILYMSQFAPGGRDSISWPVGVPESHSPKNRFDLIRWDYFTETHIFFQDDFTNVKQLIGADKLDIQDVIKVSIEKLNQKYNNKYLYSYLINGYRRFDPQRGMEYILDLALDDTSLPSAESDKRPVVEKRVFLVRPLGEVEIIPMPYVTESTRVHIILPITVRDMDGLGSFLESYASLQTEAEGRLALVLVFIYQSFPKMAEDDVYSVVKSMAKYHDEKTKSGIKSIILNFACNETFIPDYQMIDLVSSNLNNDALMLMGTIGMILNTEMLNRVRINTIAGWQVFFPIGFWQYRPNLIYEKKPYPVDIEFTSRAGHYDVLSFEHGSFYNTDYKDARKSLTNSEILNCDVYEMFVKYGKLHVFRAVEPEFKHHYIQLECHPNSPPILYERCVERRVQSLGTRSQLAKLIFHYQAKNKKTTPLEVTPQKPHKENMHQNSSNINIHQELAKQDKHQKLKREDASKKSGKVEAQPPAGKVK